MQDHVGHHILYSPRNKNKQVLKKVSAKKSSDFSSSNEILTGWYPSLWLLWPVRDLFHSACHEKRWCTNNLVKLSVSLWRYELQGFATNFKRHTMYQGTNTLQSCVQCPSSDIGGSEYGGTQLFVRPTEKRGWSEMMSSAGVGEKRQREDQLDEQWLQCHIMSHLECTCFLSQPDCTSGFHGLLRWWPPAPFPIPSSLWGVISEDHRKAPDRQPQPQLPQALPSWLQRQHPGSCSPE